MVIIVLHAKASNDTASLQRRQNASNALKSHLDATDPTGKVFVIGDFNDDVDTSITSGKPSPYQNFVTDSLDYTFITKALTDAGVSRCASTSPRVLKTSDPVDQSHFSAAATRDLVPKSADPVPLP